MEENRMESTVVGCVPRSETMARRLSYAPPRMEIHAAEPSRLMGTSFYGTHAAADGGDSDHERAGDGGEITGAKAVILGQEFSFGDVWEE